MTRDELNALLGNRDLMKDLDIKTLILDLMREKFTMEELVELFWKHLDDLDADFVSGYFYRRFSS